MLKSTVSVAGIMSSLLILGAGCAVQPQTTVNNPPAAPVAAPVAQPVAPVAQPAPAVMPSPAPTPKPTPAPKPTPPKNQTYRVSISNFAFKPANLSIKVGDTVIWHQSDSAPHSVILGDGTASPIMQKGEEYAHTFAGPGAFDFHCGVHPSMTGTVTAK